LRVDVEVPLERRTNVLIIPRRAVHVADGAATVRVKSAGGIRPQAVRTGAHDGLHIEILDGLREGDVVVY
jgi:hypothetical protein